MLSIGLPEDEKLDIQREARRAGILKALTREYERLYYQEAPPILADVMDAVENAKFETKLKSYLCTFAFDPKAKLIDIKDYIDKVTSRSWINDTGKYGKVGRYEIYKSEKGIHYHLLFTLNQNRKPSNIITSFWHLAKVGKLIGNRAGIDLKVRRRTKEQWEAGLSYVSKGLSNTKEFELNKAMESGGSILDANFDLFSVNKWGKR